MGPAVWLRQVPLPALRRRQGRDDATEGAGACCPRLRFHYLLHVSERAPSDRPADGGAGQPALFKAGGDRRDGGSETERDRSAGLGWRGARALQEGIRRRRSLGMQVGRAGERGVREETWAGRFRAGGRTEQSGGNDWRGGRRSGGLRLLPLFHVTCGIASSCLSPPGGTEQERSFSSTSAANGIVGFFEWTIIYHNMYIKFLI